VLAAISVWLVCEFADKYPLRNNRIKRECHYKTKKEGGRGHERPGGAALLEMQ
jgi:hypothetical protein